MIPILIPFHISNDINTQDISLNPNVVYNIFIYLNIVLILLGLVLIIKTIFLAFNLYKIKKNSKNDLFSINLYNFKIQKYIGLIIIISLLLLFTNLMFYH